MIRAVPPHSFASNAQTLLTSDVGTTEQITAEYPTVTAAGVRAAAAYGAALAREELLPIPQPR